MQIRVDHPVGMMKDVNSFRADRNRQNTGFINET